MPTATEVKVLEAEKMSRRISATQCFLDRRPVPHVYVNALHTKALFAQGLNRRHQIAT